MAIVVRDPTPEDIARFLATRSAIQPIPPVNSIPSFCFSLAQHTVTMQAENDIMVRFQGALDICVSSWSAGNALAMLQDNLQKLLGDAALAYFKQTLMASVGEPVSFTFSSGDGDDERTIVQMPEKQSAQPVQLFSDLSITKPFPKTVKTTQITMSTGVKKTPRPMNCWIIFRDTMHKFLKLQYPNIRVQEISTYCSRVWRNLDPSEKEQWVNAAKNAKEQHLRIHPDYKYSPRKPGEKKRRQSRKAKVTASPVVATINTETSPMPVSLPLATIEARGLALNPYYYNEAARHAQLEAEFEQSSEADVARELFGDEVLAFRTDADDNVGLSALTPRF